MSAGSGSSIRVLHVDDNRDLAQVVAMHLERADERLEVATETSAREALDRLTDGEAVDCVVSDHDMPGMDGLEFLTAVRERWPDLPFLLFTGKGSEEIASEAISAGVTEYLQKETGSHQYTVLANRIEQAVEAERAKDALEESERMLSTLISNLPGMAYRARNERGWPMEFVSEGCQELTGYEPAALESGAVNWGEDVLLEEEREELWDRVQHALDAREPFEVSYRIRTKAGERRWMWERGSGVYEDGDLVALEGFITDITARKQRERELRDQQEFIESLLDALGDPFYLMGPDGDLLRWNDAVSETTGYTESEIATMRAADFLADEDVPKLIEGLERAIEEGQARLEFEILTKAGDRIPFEMHVAPVYDAADEFVGTVGIGRDMSQRLERERELEEYRTLVENVGDPMYVLSPEGEIEMVNNAMVEHLGYPREELEGAPPEKVMPEEDVQRGYDLVADLLETDEQTWGTMEMRTLHADGSVTHNEDMMAVVTDEDGDLVSSVGVIRDISERLEREHELERFETIIQAVGDPVYAVDDEGTFTFVNEAFEPMTGYTAEELQGRHVTTVIDDDDVAQGREYVREMVAGERDGMKYEITVEHRDGSTLPCEIHVAPLPFDDWFRGTAGIIRDISERKQREERLDEFASVVSHDIRSPLNVIMGRSELALETGDDEHLEAIQDSAARMDTLVEDLLALARQGRTVGDVDPVDLEDLVEAAWHNVATGEATLHTAAGVSLEADRERLRELLENLLRNACEHAGPAVTVTVEDTEWGFFVADDGPGIPPAEREHVLEQGYTTGVDGTGFGLAIVRRIAEAHDWDVAVTESAAGGARFEFRT